MKTLLFKRPRIISSRSMNMRFYVSEIYLEPPERDRWTYEISATINDQPVVCEYDRYPRIKKLQITHDLLEEYCQKYLNTRFEK